jgi:hypothetical protein
MNINVPRRQALGSLAAAALIAGTIAAGLSNPLAAHDPPAPKADDFSPYVTKDGGISLPLDYGEKFPHRKRTRRTGSLPKFGGPFHSLRTKRRGIESHGSVTRVELLRIKGKGFIS